MSDPLKDQVDKLFENTEKPKNPRTAKVHIAPENLREIIPEAKRSKLHFPPFQVLGILAIVLPLAFVVRSCVVPGTPEKVTLQTQAIPQAQAATSTVICGPANQTDPVCQLRKMQADQALKSQENVIKASPTSTPTPAVKKIPTTQISRVPYSQVPQEYRSQPVFRRQVIQSQPQPQPISQAPIAMAAPPRNAEAIWNEMARDGVTGAENNSFVPPSPEPAYTQDLDTTEIPQTSGQSFKGKPKAEGEGKLTQPIQLTSDVDAAEEEYEINVTKGFSNFPEGTKLYAKIDGVPSQAGFIKLRLVGSSLGELPSQPIEIKKPDGSKLKASMKGTGRGIGNTIASILFGGVRIAMGGILGGGGALNAIGQNASNEGISAAQNAFQNRRAAPYFELSKGTTVKFLVY